MHAAVRRRASKPSKLLSGENRPVSPRFTVPRRAGREGGPLRIVSVGVCSCFVENGVQLIAFGNGQCSARGHRKVPTKQIIRHQASILYWQNTCLTHITTPQVSQGDVSSQSQSTNPSDEDDIYVTDTRIECRKVWNTDEVSVVNLAHVISAMLQGREMPIWLETECHATAIEMNKTFT